MRSAQIAELLVVEVVHRYRSGGRRGGGGRARVPVRSRRGRCRGRCVAAGLPRRAGRASGTRSTRSPGEAERGHARPRPRRSDGARDPPSTCPRSTGAAASGACPWRAARSARSRWVCACSAGSGSRRVTIRLIMPATPDRTGGPNRQTEPVCGAVANESRHTPREPAPRWGFLQASCDKLPAAKEADDGPLDESADPRRVVAARRLRRRRAVPAPARLGPVPLLRPPEPGARRARLARLHVRPAARVRRRPHRGDRQHDPEVAPGRQAVAWASASSSRSATRRSCSRSRPASRSRRRRSTQDPGFQDSAATSARPCREPSCS